MIKLRTILNEYITNPIIDLKNYLNQSDSEKANELLLGGYFPNIYEWLIANTEISSEFEEMDEYDIPYELKEKYPSVYEDIHEIIKNDLESYALHAGAVLPGYPTWLQCDYRNLIKNQWLIHFSDYSYDIYKNKKFKNLVDDFTMLSLTTMWKSDSYNRSEHGFGFAFTLQDLHKKSSQYGNEAVMFRASGIRIYHYGDDEYQTIFYGPTATDFVYISKNNDEWSVGDFYSSGDVEDVAYWVTENYSQYKNKL